MKLKLIAPKCGVGQATNLYPPYVLATLAALTPPEIDVIIEDQNVQEIDFDEPVDMGNGRIGKYQRMCEACVKGNRK